MAIIIIALVYVSEEHLSKQSQVLQDARDALCAGNLDFIASIGNGGVVVAYAPNVESQRLLSESLGSLYQYRAFRSLIEDESPTHMDIHDGAAYDTTYGFSGSRFTVEGRRGLDIVDGSVLINPSCHDYGYPGSTIWPTLSDVLASEAYKDAVINPETEDGGRDVPMMTFNSCSDVEPFCGFESTLGLRARQFCPTTCGCGHPVLPLSLFHPVHGCPRSCTERGDYTQMLGEISCSDWTPESPTAFRDRDLLESYYQGLFRSGWPALRVNQIIQPLNETLHTYGCSVTVQVMMSDTSHWWPGNLCDEVNAFMLRPITTICPVSCGCQQKLGMLCPTSCGPPAG